MEVIPDMFQEKQPSLLSHHGQKCCEVAWHWFRAMDYSLRGGGSSNPPAWLRDEFDWGPSTWPIYWCDVMQTDSFDCGVFAAVARALLHSREASVVAVQLVEHFNEENVTNWRSRWTEADSNVDWVAGSVAYHEAVGLLEEDRIVIWDPVDNLLVVPPNGDGYGELAALRIYEPEQWEGAETYDWNGIELEIGIWITNFR